MTKYTQWAKSDLLQTVIVNNQKNFHKVFCQCPQMLIGLCGAEAVSKSAVSAAQGFLGCALTHSSIHDSSQSADRDWNTEVVLCLN